MLGSVPVNGSLCLEIVNRDFVASLAFGLVKRVVGAGVEAGEVIGWLRERAADARGDRMLLVPVGDFTRDRGADALANHADDAA